ncbi:MAG: SDR family oxidoreductase [Devosia sp.]|uniref:SDR family oxidoreductase n=1 Tax=Devosia sp. TaxID=1871048 RepID=UPI001AD584F5|nr:SDR family oxidoreductase [Devosia sp.]MBN9317061.1 SDR family oxidoreductase [Devosia sp.]
MAEQVLVVTGGSRGIGAAVARLAAARGYGVVLNYLGNVAAAEAVCATIHAAGGEAVAVRGDVGREEDIEHIFRAADRMGPLRALVNNAGMIAPVARLDAMEPDRIAEILRVNVLGTMLCSAAAVRRMSTRHGGKGGGIVNLSSAAAKLGAPGAYLDYAASKGAIDTFTVGLAVEVAGEGIRVNGVRPGIIDTDFHAQGGEPDRVQRLASTIPMGRPGTADEVAQTILWLLSEDASYVTGTTLAVTGGRAVVP